jgi:hypothetical protein
MKTINFTKIFINIYKNPALARPLEASLGPRSVHLGQRAPPVYSLPSALNADATGELDVLGHDILNRSTSYE